MNFENFVQPEWSQGEWSSLEAQEMELATQLLGVRNEQEMEQFFGSLLSSAAKQIGAFARGPAGQQLLGLMKSTAKQALPQLGRAVGSHFGGTAGGQLGANLASQAGQLFGLELESLSHEDREFELAQQVVRLGQAAASQLPPNASSAEARQAYVQAVRTHAPGLIGAAASTSFPRAGTWQRQGDAIVLH